MSNVKGFSFADIADMIDGKSLWLAKYSEVTKGTFTKVKFVDLNTDHTYMVYTKGNEIISVKPSSLEEAEFEILCTILR